MNNSSQQVNCSVTSTSINTIDLSSLDTITITGSGSSYTSDSIVLDLSAGAATTSFGYSSTVTTTGISNASIGTLSISDIGINWTTPTEFVDCMPDLNRIEEMCKEYPGLKIAFEKFKTTYNLVKDDYDTPKDKRTKP